MSASSSDAHPFPIYNARYRVTFPLFDADGDLVTGATTPDSEVSQDGGTFADATNEMTEIATASGMYFLDLTAGEMDTKSTAVIAKSATAGMKTTPLVLYPVRLPVIRTGTAQAGGASSITLDSSASAITDYYVGCYVNITNNTPTNAQGQARMITAYNGSTKVATVEGTYGTNPSSSSTFEVLATADWIFRFGDILAYSGTAGTFAAGRAEVNTTHWAGTAVASANVLIDNAITAAKIATGAIDADAIADNAIDAGAIASNAITDTKIATGAITAAKFAAGAIDAAAIADGAIDAGAIAADAITAAKIATGAIDADAIADNAIDAGAIASNAITDTKIATGAITAAKFAAGAIDAAAIADNAIDAGAIAADAITAAKIADNAIDAGAIAADAITAAKIATGALTAAKFAAGAIDAAALATDAVTEIAQGILDRALSSHTTAGTVGQRLQFVRAGTAQAGASGSITLDGSASAVDDFYNGDLIVLTSGTGVGQARIISDYVGSTKVATVAVAWATTPDNTSVFMILPNAASLISGTVDANVVSLASNAVTAAALASDAVTEIQSGLATAAALATVDGNVDTIQAAVVQLAVTTGTVVDDAANSATTFETTLSETATDHWKDAFLVLTSGALVGQVKRVSAYDGSTKFVTVSGGFTAEPAAGVTFALVNR